MFYDDEEFFEPDFYQDENGEYICDQSKAESIMRKAAEDLQDALSEKAKAIIQQAKEAKDQLEKTKQQIAWNECRIHETEMELREAQKKADDFEKREMPAKYIQAFVRDATGFYAPGDKAFIVETKYTQKDCPFCKGKFRINVQFGDEMLTVSDPHCRGNGYITEEHLVIEETEIKEVRLMLCFEKSRVSYWSTDSVYICGREYAIKPDRLFRTREEAEAKVKELEAKNK